MASAVVRLREIGLVLNPLPLLVHSGTLTHWTELPLLRVGLPTSVSLVQKIPHIHIQRFVCYMILDPIKLATNITQH